MRKSQGILRYSKPNGTSAEQPHQLRLALLWAGDWSKTIPPCPPTYLPPSLHHYLIGCHPCMDREVQVSCRSCAPIIAMSKLMHCSSRSWWTRTIPESLPSSGPLGKHIYLLQKERIGRAALQDASDVLLKWMLWLSQDTKRGNSNIFVFSGTQQGRGCRVDCTSTKEHQIGEHSLNQKHLNYVRV